MSSFLQSRAEYESGTFRSASAATTLARIKPLLSTCGITRLANVTGLDTIGIPVYVAVRPNARSLAVAQGKGLTPLDARVSALMEAIECWHAESIDLEETTATFATLGAKALDPALLEVQLPQRIDRSLSMPFVSGENLFSGERVWVPKDMVTLDFVFRESNPPTFVQHTNGLASGNTRAEAALHALYELIERDATSLWFMDTSAVDVGKIDPTTIHDGACRELLRRIEAADLHVGIYDIASNIDVPVYATIVVDKANCARAVGYFWGFGCHLQPEVALARALTEAVQCRLTEIAGARDDISRSVYAVNRSADELSETVSLLFADKGKPFSSSSRAGKGVEEDLEHTLRILDRCGIRSVVAVDLTRPAVGIPVVRVLAPELEGIHNEHVPGTRARTLLSKSNEHRRLSRAYPST